MNQYTKNVWKRNITAFLLSAGLLFGVSAAVLLLVTIGDLLGNALPYVMLVLAVFAIIWFLSIPIRDYLEDRENHKRYWELKDRERLAREAIKEEHNKKIKKMSEQMQVAHTVRKRDNLV